MEVLGQSYAELLRKKKLFIPEGTSTFCTAFRTERKGFRKHRLVSSGKLEFVLNVTSQRLKTVKLYLQPQTEVLGRLAYSPFPLKNVIKMKDRHEGY